LAIGSNYIKPEGDPFDYYAYNYGSETTTEFLSLKSTAESGKRTTQMPDLRPTRPVIAKSVLRVVSANATEADVEKCQSSYDFHIEHQSSWNSWFPWGACDRECNGGSRRRFLCDCDTNTATCKVDREQVEECNMQECEVPTYPAMSFRLEFGNKGRLFLFDHNAAYSGTVCKGFDDDNGNYEISIERPGAKNICRAMGFEDVATVQQAQDRVEENLQDILNSANNDDALPAVIASGLQDRANAVEIEGDPPFCLPEIDMCLKSTVIQKGRGCYKHYTDIFMECTPKNDDSGQGMWTSWTEWTGCDPQQPEFLSRFRLCLNGGPYFSPMGLHLKCEGDEQGLSSFFERKNCPTNEERNGEYDYESQGSYSSYTYEHNYYYSSASSENVSEDVETMFLAH
jgi:hypothetical protein